MLKIVLPLVLALTCCANQRPGVLFNKGCAGLRPKECNPTYVFNERVSNASVKDFEDWSARWVHSGAQSLTIEMDSYGGQLNAAVNMGSWLDYLKTPVVCKVHRAQSAMFYILQYCDKRLVFKDGQLMLHAPYIDHGVVDAYGNHDLELVSERLQRILVEFYSLRLKLSADEIGWFLTSGTPWFMDANQALYYGAVDGILP